MFFGQKLDFPPSSPSLVNKTFTETCCVWFYLLTAPPPQKHLHMGPSLIGGRGLTFDGHWSERVTARPPLTFPAVFEEVCGSDGCFMTFIAPLKRFLFFFFFWCFVFLYLSWFQLCSLFLQFCFLVRAAAAALFSSSSFSWVFDLETNNPSQGIVFKSHSLKTFIYTTYWVLF